ncbi:defensin-1-like isoform X2 [Ceratina calcarata]|uniref:Defensin-1-like isoform X2 n=1 Tax=Ceratina calcarata TaxID=156304 RepID=A0AAJ7WAE5_9HYME|nr:defensin-1-like isoform X2 [Ceratina calcarata]
MKIYFLFALFWWLLPLITAAPIDDMEAVEERADRQRRVTCDLLSALRVQDSACAANCLSMGKAGGHCENGICVCRKTTFNELWNDRFDKKGNFTLLQPKELEAVLRPTKVPPFVYRPPESTTTKKMS